MEVKLRLSGNLRLIYKDLNEEMSVIVEGPISILNLLKKLGVNPFVAPLVLVNGEKKDKNFIIEGESVEVVVIGPLAGG